MPLRSTGPQFPPAPPQQNPGQGPGQNPVPQFPVAIPALPPPPKKGRIGDIPIKAVYLIGAVAGTVAAVLLIFFLFQGDVPTPQAGPTLPPAVQPASPLPSGTAAAATPTPTVTQSPIVLPAVPEKKTFAKLPGKASAVTGLINDTKNGISYPRLGKPWDAKSFAPFTIAQRVGKVGIPHTMIVSALFPGDSPETKPSKDADYREIATRAARWAVRTQFPKDAKVEWTGSEKVPVGKGWTLGFKVTYQFGGKQMVSQSMVTVIEIGKTKPAMLLATIPDTGKKYWADLNTLAKRVRPL
ncbi:hypothetical protein HII36_47070 [Nonomuraea sp. NN258]|uniref:hypothetical protein n=1 Tax=Nonomuraea antri TaxID=2730852 RepID=UPI001569BA40|nr:hypothetical protein [Nonomuraea antri]NRQ39336.1 hypothetical protein [Nonomuraea antri]